MANVDPGVPPQNQDVGAPLQGLFLDRPAWKIPPGGLSACNNVRIEFGRVRSDLLGWQLYENVGSPIVYESTFIDSKNNVTPFVVTATDILSLSPTGALAYVTPQYNIGVATATNGSAALTGTGTRWATDIQFGTAQDTYAAALNAAVGATQIFLSGIAPVSAWTILPPGLSVVDQDNAAAVAPGTYLTEVGFAPGQGNYILLSQALTQEVLIGDKIQIGSGVSLRSNVRPGDQIFIGTDNQTSLAASWYTVQSVNSDTSITLTAPYAGISGTYYHTVRQLLTNTVASASPHLPSCSSANYPASGGYNNIPHYNNANLLAGCDNWIFTNGIDPVVVFSSAYTNNAFFARTVPFVCSCVLQKQGLMVYGGLTEPGSTTILGTTIANSDNGFPLQLAGGVSFQGIATDGPFLITRLAVLGSQMMIYCSGKYASGPDLNDDVAGCVTSASFVGFPTIWAFADVVKTRGPVVGGAVAEFPDRHQFLAIDGEYRYNGLFIQVMNDQVWRSVMKQFDTTRPGAAFAFIVPETGDLLWATPLTTDAPGQLQASTAYVEHYMEQANSYLFKPMTQRDFPFSAIAAFAPNSAVTWASFGAMTFNQLTVPWTSFAASGVMPSYYAGDLAGNLWLLYVSNTQNGTPALCTATWGAKVLGNARSRALVKRVYPEIEYIAAPTGTVSVTLTLADALGGPTTITDTQQFDPSYQGNRFTTHYRRGRLGAVTISDQSGLGWVSDGWDWDWVPGGLR